MKKGTAFFLLSILLLCCAGAALAQDLTPITVKKTDTVKGVVVVFILKDAKTTLQLQCNEGAPSCTSLKAGKYQMLQLPENRGMYDCKDVQVYGEKADPEKDEKLGEYCMIE